MDNNQYDWNSTSVEGFTATVDDNNTKCDKNDPPGD